MSDAKHAAAHLEQALAHLKAALHLWQPANTAAKWALQSTAEELAIFIDEVGPGKSGG